MGDRVARGLAAPLRLPKGASRAPRLSAIRPPVSATVGSTVTIHGRTTLRGKGLVVHLQDRRRRGWHEDARVKLAVRGDTFAVRWRPRLVATPATLRLTVTKTVGGRQRTVARSASWLMRVVKMVGGSWAPVIGQSGAPPQLGRPTGRVPPAIVRPPVPSSSSPASTVPTPTTTVPTTSPAGPLELTSATVRLPVGSVVPIPLDGVLSIASIDSVAMPDGLAADLRADQLTLSAANDAKPGHHMETITAHGCTSAGCDRELVAHVPVDVVGFEAPPGLVAEFQVASPDRVDLGTDPPAGLAGTILSDQVLVTLGTADLPGTREDADAVAATVDARVSGGIASEGIFVLRWKTPQDLGVRKAALEAQPGVAGVTVSTVGMLGADALPPGDWNDDGDQTIWPFDQIHAQQAWEYQRGGFVKLGVVDMGVVAARHEDLNVVKTVSRGAATGHATHVAGLACAKANGVGVVGVAWGCPVVSSAVNSENDDAYLVAAIQVLQEPEVKVINMSLGDSFKDRHCASPQESAEIAAFERQNALPWQRLFQGKTGREVLWTLSAGNLCADVVASPFGQNAALPNVVTVAATNSDKTLATFSDFGDSVEVAAPGGVDVNLPFNGTVGLWSTWSGPGEPECGPGYEYCWLYGTSMAAPIVAGIAVLMRTAHPQDSAADVGKCILRTAGVDVGWATTQSAYPKAYKPKITMTLDQQLPIVNADAAVRCRPGEFTATTTSGTVTGALNQAINAQLSVTGGKPPYTWALDHYVGIGGLTLSADGLLTGTPRSAGRGSIVAKVTDANGDVATVTVKVDVAYGTAPPISGHVQRLTHGNADSWVSDVSTDGSTVIVATRATNLVPGPSRANPEATDELLSFDTISGTPTRITNGTGNTGGALTNHDGSLVVFNSNESDLVPGDDPTPGKWDLYLWSRADQSIRRLTTTPDDPSLMAMSDDGRRLAFGTYVDGWHLFIIDVTTGVTTELSDDPALDYGRSMNFSADGTKVVYGAYPAGTNYVPFIHVRDLVTGDDVATRYQTDGGLAFGDSSTQIVSGTYQGFFNNGLMTLTWPGQSPTYLDGGVNGVFDASVPATGSCIVVHSWEPTALTADPPNRGEAYYYTDAFTYDLRSHTYTRLTNTFNDDAWRSAVTSAGCLVTALALSPASLDPERPEERSPQDIYLTRP